MNKTKLNDISDNVIYDLNNFEYQIKNSIDDFDYQFKNILSDNVKNKIINLPTISQIILKNYPFIEKRNSEIINQIIQRNHKIKLLIDYAVKNKKAQNLDFYQLDEQDKYIVKLAKSIVYDLNKFIYKYDITKIYSNLTFLNLDFNYEFLGTIDIVCANNDQWFLISLKTSLSGYNQKYFAELFLQKTLFENNTKFKISEMFIFNPREQRVIIKANEISNNEKHRLLQAIKTNK